jgi:DNA-binding response OmpR family regulator
MTSVLVVDDEPQIVRALRINLSARGYDVMTAYDGKSALGVAVEGKPDVVVLDLGLPDLDGSDALRMLRGITDVPIIIATARDDEQTVVRLLRAGADDYMVKPFTGAHLDARITTVLRRVGRASRTAQPAVHEVGELRVDVGERSASLAEQPLALTRKEFDLLAYLAARPGRVVSRRELLEEVWRQPSVGEDQTIDVHLYWLRRKLGESAAKPRYLRTVRGVGFRLVAPD